ncbi:hypothetical protein PPERSA_12178 [Pseudocohnilembus persalinus]|uniref:SP-RING-type domain-containing protein n=1 Tax=Pseudocohnilembus persalinus TaxID=266149 RepID=A0A0V0R937_PSEPJ|nr:hypothetical protein PPERSA_12178 [Pseudocohnilembus persalinus]|eukprot:KRX10896.1 hypothetical protein PPERSA_12178 [Pseudocohnilembus persalinus]
MQKFQKLNDGQQIQTNQEQQEITFQLTQKQLKKLQQKKINLELKCLQTGHPYEITFPLEAQFYVNNQLLGQFKKLAQNSSLKKRKDQELIFKHINFLKIGKNLLSFNISDDLKRKNYYFQLQLVKLISPENLIENYTKESKIIPIKNQIQDIKNNFSQDSNPKRFRCPICNQVAFQLVIDELMQFILNFVNQKQNPQICSEVIFNSKGGFFIKEDDDYEEIEFNHNGIKEENFIYLNQNFNGIQNQDSNENKKQNKIIVIEIDDEDDQENSEDNYNNYDKNNNYSSINIQKNAQSNNFYDNDLSFSNQQEEEKIQDNRYTKDDPIELD